MPTVRIRGAREHNLKNIDLDIPWDALVVFTGVSGSGKSSLLMDSLVPALQVELGKPEAVAPASLTLPEGIKRMVVVNQKPIGRTPRSTPATYTGVMDALRALFASTTLAKARGYTPGRLSLNRNARRGPH